MPYKYNGNKLTRESLMEIYGKPGLRLESAKKGKYGYELRYVNEYGGSGWGFLSFIKIENYLKKAK